RVDTGVTLGHRLLHRDGTAHRIDDAGKFDQQTVAGGLDKAAPVLRDLWINKLAAQRLEAVERAFFVRPHHPLIPRSIGGEDRGETAGGGHLDPKGSVEGSRLTQNPRHCSPSAARGEPFESAPENCEAYSDGGDWQNPDSGKRQAAPLGELEFQIISP